MGSSTARMCNGFSRVKSQRRLMHVTPAGSSSAFAVVMAVGWRLAIGCALVSLAAFTASALVSALVPRWWLAALCSVGLTVASIVWGGDFFLFDYFPDTPNGTPQSVTVGFGTGHAKWVEISRAIRPDELNLVAHWKLWPLLTTALLIAAFSVATALLYERKELK